MTEEALCATCEHPQRVHHHHYGAGLRPGGFGQMWDPIARRRRDAHRIAYEMFVGPIPEGLQIDHLCRVKRCVNPGHLETVPQAENNRRGLSPTAENARKTHCVNGHELTPENVYVPPGRTARQCRRCQYLRNLRIRKGAS